MGGNELLCAALVCLAAGTALDTHYDDSPLSVVDRQCIRVL
jgi:hypothetical protein